MCAISPCDDAIGQRGSHARQVPGLWARAAFKRHAPSARALAEAGLSDVHLLPVFDLATVPEAGCLTPTVPDPAQTGPASEAQQAAVMAVAAQRLLQLGL